MAHCEVKFFSVSGTLGVEALNAPGKVNILVSNLTGPNIVFKREIFCFKKILGLLFVVLCFVGLFETSWNCFFLFLHFFVYDLSAWIRSCNCNFTSLGFVCCPFLISPIFFSLLNFFAPLRIEQIAKNQSFS